MGCGDGMLRTQAFELQGVKMETMWIVCECCGQPKYSVISETCEESKRRLNVKCMTFEHIRSGQHKNEDCKIVSRNVGWWVMIEAEGCSDFYDKCSK